MLQRGRLGSSQRKSGEANDDLLINMETSGHAVSGRQLRSDDSSAAVRDANGVDVDVEHASGYPKTTQLPPEAYKGGGGNGMEVPMTLVESMHSSESPFHMSAHGGMPDHFRRQLLKKQLRELVFELREDGTSEIRETTVRDLYDYIQACVAPYDHMNTRRMSMGSMTDAARNSSGGISDSGHHGAHAAAHAAQFAAAQRAAAAYLASHPPPDPTTMDNLPLSDADPRQSISSRAGAAGARLQRQPSAGAFVSSLYLHNRDLRKMFAITSNAEPSIQVRRNVILMNFEQLRAIVLVDRVVLLLPDGADSVVTDFARTMKEFEDEHSLSSETVEFEMRAMEAVMSVSAHWLEKEVDKVQPRVSHITMAMEGPGNTATSPEANDSFRALKNVVSELETRAKARRRAILQVLEEDEDLALMNLSKMKNDPEAYEMPLKLEVLEDHEEVELLLEAFLQEVNSLSNKLEILRERLLNTESLVMVRLDIARNRLLTANTVFGIATMCVASATLLTGVFGMNLRSTHEESHAWFQWVVGIAGFLCVVPVSLVLLWMKRMGLLF